MQESVTLDAQIMLLERMKQELRGLRRTDGTGHVHGCGGHFALRAHTLRELRVAAIVDSFTLECFRPECELTELTPEGWLEELDRAKPDLIFIESAWHGKNDLWHGKVATASAELYGLAGHCHRKGIPIVFWSKEDPVHWNDFLHVAGLADFVFTADMGSVAAYRRELGHSRVFFMHFAAQPRLHNPIETHPRKDRFCFAGSYPHRYKDRCARFDAFASYFIGTRGLDIYDRNGLSQNPKAAFPSQYAPHILGALDPSEIDVAYKGYRFGINMNSITQSQTMFARRVFELMASNTVVAGNYSRGVKNCFGDLTICTDDAGTLRHAVESLDAIPGQLDKLRLAALRQVLRYHLYEDRLAYIVEKVFVQKLKHAPPRICVCASASTQAETDRVVAMFRRQSYGSKRLILVSDAAASPQDGILPVARADWQRDAQSLLAGTEYIACFHPSDWYGENYLLDLALATRYGDFDVIGKGTFYARDSDTFVRRADAAPYAMADELPLRRAMARASLCTGMPEADYACRTGSVFSIDPFNYCQSWDGEHCPVAADLDIYDRGIPVDRLEMACSAIGCETLPKGKLELGAAQLANRPLPEWGGVSLREADGTAVLESGLPSAKRPKWMDLSDIYDMAPCLDEQGLLPVLVEGTGAGSMRFVCRFYDRTGADLGTASVPLGRHRRVRPPLTASGVRVQVALSGAGRAVLHRIVVGNGGPGRPMGGYYLTSSDGLVIAQDYPGAEEPGHCAELHRALLALRKRGRLLDVLELHADGTERFREHEGIPIIEGTAATLAAILATGGIRTACVCCEPGKAAQELLDAFRPVLRVARFEDWQEAACGLEELFPGKEDRQMRA